MDTTAETQDTPETGDIKRKMHFKGKVLKTTLGGAIVDIGKDKPGIVHISHLREEPVNRVEDVVQVGQEVEVWVRRIDKKSGTIELTMIEPLGLEWREIRKGLRVTGKITRIERYGVFVDIGAERPGMIHISELSHDFVKNPYEVIKLEEEVEVEVIDFNRRKKQIKLSRKAVLSKPAEVEPEVVEEEVEETDEEKPVPTALEMALREAMQKRPVQPAAKTQRKVKGKKGNELDDILSRTLQGYNK